MVVQGVLAPGSWPAFPFPTARDLLCRTLWILSHPALSPLPQNAQNLEVGSKGRRSGGGGPADAKCDLGVAAHVIACPTHRLVSWDGGKLEPAQVKSLLRHWVQDPSCTNCGTALIIFWIFSKSGIHFFQELVTLLLSSWWMNLLVNKIYFFTVLLGPTFPIVTEYSVS